MHRNEASAGLEGAIELLKTLRRIDVQTGVRNSRIAFDVALALFEAGPDGALCVDHIADTTGYSGPTVRLVLKRLGEAGTIAPDKRVGKTQFYALTERGRATFMLYLTAINQFRDQGGGPDSRVD